jgi:hypothetical protein
MLPASGAPAHPAAGGPPPGFFAGGAPAAFAFDGRPTGQLPADDYQTGILSGGPGPEPYGPDGYPANHPASGHADGGYPAGHVDGGLPAGHVDGGYPAGYVDGRYPAGYVDGGLPAGHVDGGYPAGYVDGGVPGAGYADGGYPGAGYADGGFAVADADGGYPGAGYASGAYDDRPPAVLARARVYRSSPIEALANLLRPTGTKLLMGATVLVLVVAASQAFDLVELPFLGDSPDGDQVVAAGDLTTTTAPAEVGGTATTGANTDPTRFGAGDADSVTTVTVEPATSEATTTTGAVVEETTTTAEPTTTTGAPASTDSTATSLDPSSTSSTPLVTLVPNDFLEPGQSYGVPAEAPAGTYRAEVKSEGGCSITIERVGRPAEIVNADTGEEISIDLAEGESVEIGEGCPRLDPVVSTP